MWFHIIDNQTLGCIDIYSHRHNLEDHLEDTWKQGNCKLEKKSSICDIPNTTKEKENIYKIVTFTRYIFIHSSKYYSLKNYV